MVNKGRRAVRWGSTGPCGDLKVEDISFALTEPTCLGSGWSQGHWGEELGFRLGTWGVGAGVQVGP